MADAQQDLRSEEGSAGGRSPHTVRFTPPPVYSISVRGRRSRDLRNREQGERLHPMRVEQCGVDVRAAAREFGNAGLSLPLRERELTEVERLRGGRRPEPYGSPDAGGGFDVEHAVRGLFHDTYNRRDLSAIERLYAPGVRWHGATNREGYGRADVREMARNLLATFPGLGMHVDEVYWMGNEREGFAVSARWTAIGTHRGFGLYGPPTGRRVHIWGISQLYLSANRIVEEWSLFNEFDVLAQLLCDEALSLDADRA